MAENNRYAIDIEKRFLLAITIFLLIISAYVIKDLFTKIIYSMIIAYFLYPLFQYFFKKTKNKRIASLITILTSLIILFIPLALLSYFLILNLIKLVLEYRIYLENPHILNSQIKIIISEFSNSNVLSDIDYSSFFNKFVSFIANLSQEFFSSIPSMLATVFIILFIAYYMLIYNELIFKTFSEYVPLNISRQKEILNQIAKSLKILFKGYFITGVVQTFVAFIGYVLFGAPNILIITFLTLIISLIPYLGTPLIWVPVSVYLIITGQKIAGIGLLIYGTLIINLVDNFIRPMLMSDKDTIPPVLVFIGFIGGIFVFGISGLILGPLIISVTSIFIKSLIKTFQINH